MILYLWSFVYDIFEFSLIFNKFFSVFEYFVEYIVLVLGLSWLWDFNNSFESR